MPTGIYPRKPVVDRFMANVSPVPEAGCWLWVGCTQRPGYGRMSYNGRAEYAHRVSYELFIGQVGDFDVCHKCDTPSCVNPTHLFLGTPSDNANDMVRKMRSYVATEKAKTHCKRGHLLSGDNLYTHRATGRRQCKACVRLIRKRRNEQ